MSKLNLTRPQHEEFWDDCIKLSPKKNIKFNDDLYYNSKSINQYSLEGKLIKTYSTMSEAARENNIPFLGICLGMQMAVVEFARNVCGISEASSREFDETEVKEIYSESFEGDGIRGAIMNRLLKAAGYNIVSLNGGKNEV